jgi:putative thioredoxin
MFNKTPFDQGAGYSYGPTSTSAPTAMPVAAAPATPGADELPLVFDVSETDFEAGVLELSMQVPVLLDCWAPWCGPCKSLGPVLEKLAEAYGGRFVLAKLNTDEAPNISAALRLRSIPLVMLFVGGRPVDQFVGALPEGQIRSFLDKHLPPAPEPEDAPPSPLDVAEGLIADGDLDNAQALLDGMPDAPEPAGNERRDALKARIALARNRPPGDVTELQTRITANPRDFEARFALGALQAWAGEWSAAFDSLLEVVLRDKAEGKPERERARKQLIDWFAVCPDAEAVSRGRRYLGMYLN